MTSTEDGHNQPWSRRERPWLIPSNRKLRHLHAITLRNLTLTQDSSRPRRQTIDDEALPTTLKSPAKILALMETKQLGHSRSQDNLRPIHENDNDSSPAPSAPSAPLTPLAVNGASTPHVSPTRTKKTPPRPSLGRLRRRSTMEWASASSLQRQRKLEDVSQTRMADVFFSLHIEGIEEPVYVSELIEKTMNPNFNHIDLDDTIPAIKRLDSLNLKIWTKTGRQQNWSILLDMTLTLRSLQFVGKTLASFHHPFPPNCVVFQLTDGFYTAFTDTQPDEPLNPFAGLATKENNRTLPTSTFDALLRLAKIDDSIQDALALRIRLANELQSVVQSNQLASPQASRVTAAEDFVKTIEYATLTVQKQYNSLRQRLDEKRKDLQTRRDLLASSLKSQAAANATMKSEKEEMANMREEKQILEKSVAAQRRRISTDLTKVYPIIPLPNRQLAFTIRNLHLPNSEHLDSTKSATPDIIAAALGHAAHLLQLLSFYWAIVLPYPPHPRSSTSSITDPISALQSSTSGAATPSSSPFTSGTITSVNEKAMRIFPLFGKGAVRFRFEYGLFLLNKDIQLLLETGWGVRVLDIRQTLANLLYAVYCATAGEGELVSRKAGGVRGLMRVAREERGGPERRDSEDSTTVFGSDGGGTEIVAVGDLGAFESLKRVGRKRERKLDVAR